MNPRSIRPIHKYKPNSYIHLLTPKLLNVHFEFLATDKRVGDLVPSIKVGEAQSQITEFPFRLYITL